MAAPHDLARDPVTPLGQLSALYEKVEAAAADFAEKAVGSNAFAELLATSVTNAMVLAGAVNAVVDRGIRATRLAGRADVTRLAAQLARTEDKLERLLQEVRVLTADPAGGRNGVAARARR